MTALEQILSPIRSLLKGDPQVDSDGDVEPFVPMGAILKSGIPAGFNIYSFCEGPNGNGHIMIGAGDPAISRGAIFLGSDNGIPWERVTLPDETALISRFVRLADGRYVAAGMSSIGRAALLLGDRSAKHWESADIDLHSYAAFSTLTKLKNQTLLAAAGKMITQGKTRPSLFRSENHGQIWTQEDLDLPVTSFLSLDEAFDGTLYAGTMGDHTPIMYSSHDVGKTWEELPAFPAFKTYKMLSVKVVPTSQGEQIYVVLWGYKTKLADRVVRIYTLRPGKSEWRELPPIGDTHFIFSFYVAQDGIFYVGSEKGKVYRSRDRGMNWESIVRFSTNIGAYAFYEDHERRIWIGKDYVAPSHHSLWQLS